MLISHNRENNCMYIEPWCAITEYPADHKEILAQELTKELSAEHPLFGLALSILAKREDRDDILLENNTEYYIVHLTWSGKTEAEGFPTSQHFPDFDALSVQLAEDAEFF